MKLLFIDLNGCLNTVPYLNGLKNHTLPHVLMEEKVEQLSKFVDENDIYTVITSTWRLYTPLKVFKAYMSDLNLFDKTPVVNDGLYSEVKEYLNDIDEHVESFAIIDSIEPYKLNDLQDHYIFVNPFNGITEETIDRLNSML